MVWGTKGNGGLPFLVLHTFYKQKVLMMLLWAHAISILKWVVVVGESFSRLGVLSRGPLLSLFDMLFATRGGSGT
jgi:hypothetical protein